jgi:hypothetical protein
VLSLAFGFCGSQRRAPCYCESAVLPADRGDEVRVRARGETRSWRIRGKVATACDRRAYS